MNIVVSKLLLLYAKIKHSSSMAPQNKYPLETFGVKSEQLKTTKDGTTMSVTVFFNK